MVEQQDLFYIKDGAPAGIHRRGNRIPEGTYLHLVSVFTMNGNGEILLTRRAPGKSYEMQWENTAGAVISGEHLRDAAVRELREETGILCSPEELIDLGQLETTTRNAWMHGYFVRRDLPVEEVVLQPRETVEAKWVPLDWSLCFDPTLAEPVRIRFLYFFQQLQTFLEPKPTKDLNLSPASRTEPWLSWAQQLQFYAQQGQAYTKDPFDRERFDAISRIAAEMLANKTGVGTDKVLSLFAPDQNIYRTPSTEVRAAVFRGDKILMVKEKRPVAWSLPGGWCDIGCSPAENAEKEVWEEAGLHVRAKKMIAIEDRSREDYVTVTPFYIYKIYILCEEIGENGQFEENLETTAAEFFSLDELPPLSAARVSERAIRQCFAAKDDPYWQTYFN